MSLTASLKQVTVLALIAQTFHQVAAQEEVEQTEEKEGIQDVVGENLYELDEKSTSYFPISKIEDYAQLIQSPQDCYGPNLEFFEQLQSPEWQLCEIEAERSSIDQNGDPVKVKV